MAEFFRLNSPAEDKVISREQRIFADTVMASSGISLPVTTTSTAPKQKIKFFLDVVAFVDSTTNNEHFVKVGNYFELDHKEISRGITSQGIIDFFYTCTDRSNTGEYNWALTFVQNTAKPKENVRFYISEIVFEDSFYEWSKGWLEDSNPDNIIDKIDPDDGKLPGEDGNGDGNLVITNTLNNGLALPHHYATFNHYYDVTDTNSRTEFVYGDTTTSPWCIIARYTHDTTNSVVEYYICVNPYFSSNISVSLFNISGYSAFGNSTVGNLNLDKPGLTYIVVDNNTIPCAHLGTVGALASERFYIDYTFGTREINNVYAYKYPEQPNLLTSSVKVTGYILGAENFDDGTKILGAKLNLIHNGSNIGLYSGNGWPDWAESNIQPQYKYIFPITNKNRTWFPGSGTPEFYRGTWYIDISNIALTVNNTFSITDIGWTHPIPGNPIVEPFYLGYPFKKNITWTPYPGYPEQSLWYPDVEQIRGVTPFFEWDETGEYPIIWMKFN